MKMIKKTQQKFTVITVAAISLVLMLVFGLLNISVFFGIYYQTHERIDVIRECRGFVFNNEHKLNDSFFGSSNGQFSDMMNATDTVSYMYVRMNNNNPESPFITTNMSDSYSANTIYYIAKALADSGEHSGMYNNLMFEVEKDDINTTVVIIDISSNMSLMRSLITISIIIIIFSILFVIVFTHFLSRWAIRPVKIAFENQQRFISDASHELKTPLTVISANADVLESEIGDNKWLDNIKTQSTVMNELVHDLLDLAKLDETSDDMEITEFDLSSIVLSKSLEFECTAFESGKTFEQNITDNLIYKGNEEAIKHLVSILIDNAIKHSNANGIVRVTLTTDGNRKIFQVYNTGNGIKNEEKDKIFNRFYRSDRSRSRETGGYGLGLSIAKSIVDAHNGSISVDGEENKWISFTVIL